MRFSTVVAAFGCVLLAPGLAAYADTFTNFTLTSGTDVATVSLPSSAVATVQNFGASGVQYVYAVPFTLDGVMYSPSGPEQAAVVVGENFGNRVNYTFAVQYTSYATGTAQDVVLYEQLGPAFFTAVAGMPRFTPETVVFQAGDYFYDNTDHLTSNDTLVISRVQAPVSAVPEPSGLLLVGTGVMGMVGAMRRRLGRRG